MMLLKTQGPRWVGVVIGLLCLSSFVFAQEIPAVVPAVLKGKIITSSKEIDVPDKPKALPKKMAAQDQNQFTCDEEGKYVINFVAFFNHPLPGESMGVVVLDDKKEAVALADVSGTKGQTTLSSKIVVDSIESRGKIHVLQVYYASEKKPVVLAKKEIVLK
jgi:hypothetical protein